MQSRDVLSKWFNNRKLRTGNVPSPSQPMWLASAVPSVAPKAQQNNLYFPGWWSGEVQPQALAALSSEKQPSIHVKCVPEPVRFDGTQPDAPDAIKPQFLDRPTHCLATSSGSVSLTSSAIRQLAWPAPRKSAVQSTDCIRTRNLPNSFSTVARCANSSAVRSTIIYSTPSPSAAQ